MTKQQLQQYRAIKREMHQLENKLEELNAAACSPRTQKYDAVPGGSPTGINPSEELIAQMDELRREYLKRWSDLLLAQAAIEQAIGLLSPTARQLLRYRYIDGLRWEDICVTMSYSWRQVHRLHRDALEEVAKYGM